MLVVAILRIQIFKLLLSLVTIKTYCSTCIIVSLNQKLLVNSSMQIRYALLKVLQEIYIKLGEEFMVLLPETIPFLAELMEGEYM